MNYYNKVVMHGYITTLQTIISHGVRKYIEHCDPDN